MIKPTSFVITNQIMSNLSQLLPTKVTWTVVKHMVNSCNTLIHVKLAKTNICLLNIKEHKQYYNNFII